MYKSNLLVSIIFGVLYLLILIFVGGIAYGGSNYILKASNDDPLLMIIGSFLLLFFISSIESLSYVSILEYFYKKVIGNIQKSKNAFKIWFVYISVINILVGLLMIFIDIISINELLFGPVVIILLAILIFVILAYTYSLYASVLGKTDKLSINFGKSLKILAYSAIWMILSFIALFAVLFIIVSIIVILSLGESVLIAVALLLILSSIYITIIPIQHLIIANTILEEDKG